VSPAEAPSPSAGFAGSSCIPICAAIHRSRRLASFGQAMWVRRRQAWSGQGTVSSESLALRYSPRSAIRTPEPGNGGRFMMRMRFNLGIASPSPMTRGAVLRARPISQFHHEHPGETPKF
jgi:hypothetical protein